MGHVQNGGDKTGKSRQGAVSMWKAAIFPLQAGPYGRGCPKRNGEGASVAAVHCQDRDRPKVHVAAAPRLVEVGRVNRSRGPGN
jgi:hypothetical protein